MKEYKIYLGIALEEAKLSLTEDNLPIGSVLVIDDKIVDQNHNMSRTFGSWSEHAENSLLIRNSKLIKKSIKKDKLEVNLYTSMEPCLMCLGTAVLHRVSKIVYSCPDPIGGAVSLDIDSIGTMYNASFPKIEQGPFAKESYNLLIEFLGRHPGCTTMLGQYKSLEKDILKN
jgi:tRNA(adenine34) deaminase